MKKIDLPLLKKIVETPGAPGYEFPVRNVIIEAIKKHVDSYSVDNFGNLIAIINGKKEEKILLDAHMDEISFIVNHINKKGYIHFQPLGGFDPKTLSSQRVLVHGKKTLTGVMGTKPIHMMSPDERNIAPKLKDYFVDTGMEEKELRKYVSEGDVITRKGDVEDLGNRIIAKSLDNRICVYTLIETLKQIKSPEYTIYAVFSAQEEVGLRGASAATLDIQPKFGICLDTTIAYDTPGAAPQERVSELGKGCTISILDGYAISDYRMIDCMKKTAESKKISWQPDIMLGGGTNTARIQQLTAGGAIVGGISVPTRYIHQTIEMVDKKDIIATVELTLEGVNAIPKYDWSHK